MSDPVAKDVLTIFRAGEELPGLTFYGLTSFDDWREAPFPSAYWPGLAEGETSALHGDSWRVVVWDVALSDWPREEPWVNAVRSTLKALLDAGCVVTWLGRPGCFCDPPDLFLPSCMSEGVLAAATDDGFFDCPVRPDRPLDYLTDEQLLELRSRSRGLASMKAV